jgi:hypothetical protein
MATSLLLILVFLLYLWQVATFANITRHGDVASFKRSYKKLGQQGNVAYPRTKLPRHCTEMLQQILPEMNQSAYFAATK